MLVGVKISLTMYKFKINDYVTDIIEASSEALAKIKLAELWGCDVSQLPKMETYELS